MKIIETEIPDVKIIEPRIFGDERGYFFESYRKDVFNKHIKKVDFVQDNESCSTFGVVRGLHYQVPPYAQAKLVRVISGKVLDVAVDIRKKSPTFGKYVAFELSAENKRMMYIPHGFAHGFAVLSKVAIFTYKVDNVYSPKHEHGIIFNDEKLNINWGLNPEEMIVSEKDKKLPNLINAVLFKK